VHAALTSPAYTDGYRPHAVTVLSQQTFCRWRYASIYKFREGPRFSWQGSSPSSSLNLLQAVPGVLCSHLIPQEHVTLFFATRFIGLFLWVMLPSLFLQCRSHLHVGTTPPPASLISHCWTSVGKELCDTTNRTADSALSRHKQPTVKCFRAEIACYGLPNCDRLLRWSCSLNLRRYTHSRNSVLLKTVQNLPVCVSYVKYTTIKFLI